MANITEAYVDSFAPNASAVKNGWGLVKKNVFQNLFKSPDGTLLFGECKGSGKTPYITSADFINETPVFRCSCPSRQFPCKHSLGLLYAFTSGAEFKEAPIPENILEKRAKAEIRLEKKKEQQAGPRKVNKSALAKKLQAQLEGLKVLEKQLHQLLRAGLASVDKKKLKQIDETAKELGNYYLKEAQNELRELTMLWQLKLPEEKLYHLAFQKLQLLYAICKKGKLHLEKRLEDPALAPDTVTAIEEWLGHVWQLSELKEHGLVIKDTSLVQLSFLSEENAARKEFIDEGIWMELVSGELYVTKNYRPFRAAKQIKEDDTVLHIVQSGELMVYPGEGARRIRWQEYTLGEKPEPAQIKKHAKENLQDVLKNVKNQLKLPLADKYPIKLISFSKIGEVGEDWVLEDSSGNRLVLAEGGQEHPETIPLLGLLPAKDLEDQAILVRFSHHLETGRLEAKPLTIITDKRIIRLMG